MSLDLENIFLGTTTGDKTGDGAKAGGGKINRNFAKIKSFLETPDAILVQTGYNLVGQNLTYSASWQWRIESIIYTNPSNVVINFPFASSGKQRLDVVVVTSSNTFLRIPGIESVNNPVASAIPSGSLYVSVILVNDGVVGSPSSPIIGDNFISKIEKDGWPDYTSTGNNVFIPAPSTGQGLLIIYNIGLNSIDGVDFRSVTESYNGKEFSILNRTGSSVILNHNATTGSTGQARFLLFNEESLIIPDAGQVAFYNFNKVALSQTWKSWDDAYTKNETDVLLGSKLDASAYNQHFKGVYLTEAALIVAHPTGVAGDYAQVNETGATDVVNYNWDVEENLWVKNAVAGSGATNTDALPEGSTNLYHTSARVLATLLTGISFVTGGAIVSTDSVLVAFGKIQKQITDILTAIGLKQDILIIPSEVSASFSLTDAYAGKIIIVTSSCTITIPNGLVAGFNASFVTLAGVTLTIALGGSVVLHNNIGTTMLEKSSFTLQARTTTNNYITAGAL